MSRFFSVAVVINSRLSWRENIGRENLGVCIRHWVPWFPLGLFVRLILGLLMKYYLLVAGEGLINTNLIGIDGREA